MRTTLKRGIGRAAANGNGRAVLPPAVTLPQRISFYRQPPRRRGVGGVIAAILGWLLVAVLTVAAGLVGGAYLYFHETVNAIAAHTPALKQAQEQLDLPLPDRPAIALVVGVDERMKGVDAVEGSARSDTLLLLRADPGERALSMLSFPRDLSVQVICPDRAPFTGRINEAYSTCGPQGALETVRNLTGLPVNYLVTVNFVGFVRLVAELGGVWMDVDHRYFNPPGTGYASIDLHPGYQRLNGRQALDFVRYRHADSDIFRLARQQRFVHAMKQAVASSLSFSIDKLLKITGVVRDNLEVAGKGFNGRTVQRWGVFAFDLPPGHVFQTKIDPSCYVDLPNFLVGASKECIDRAVSEFSRPDVEAPDRATAAALGRRQKEKAPPPGKTTIVVLNGNGVPGAAADASYQLDRQGYKPVEPANGAPANAPSQEYQRTQLYYDDAIPAAKRAAAKLVGLFGGPKEVDTAAMPVAIEPLAGDAMVAVVLGRNFDGKVAGPVEEEPERKPPAVVTNPDATLAEIRAVRRQVRFPVVVPTVLEHTSHLSSEEGVRVYRMGGHRTVRLTFVTGASEYWGIQMVRWRDAPALRDPNERVTIKGRRYDLYYSGSKLELVVLRHQGTTYWVTNTLLTTLSNETMLEIAKGLRPLKGR
jgi:LCP family protein required for cell wall assembly